MPETKTRPTLASVDDYLASRASAEQGLLASLGKHKLGKGCLYFKRLSDLDIGVLETLVAESVAQVTRRYTRE